MSMIIDPGAMPDTPPPLGDPGGVPLPALPPSVDLGALAQGGMPPVPSAAPPAPAPGAAPAIPQGVDLGALAQQAAEIKRQEMADKERIQAEEDVRMQKHRADMDARYAQTGVNPEDFKPFDAQAAQEKYKYDPVQAFGSLGSVFAIIASSFTNRPMENSMYGAAAAMNAIKAGNEQEYDRAYKTWQDNQNLAIKRQNAMHQSYSDAISMVSNDMTTATERMKISAVKYGDKQMLTLLDAGLWDKATELATKREDLKVKIADNEPKLALDLYKTSMLLNDPRSKLPPGSPEHNAFVREYNEVYGNAREEDAVTKYARSVTAEYKGPEADGPYSEYFRTKMDKWYETAASNDTRKMSEAQKTFKQETNDKLGRDPTSEEWITFDQRNRATANKDADFIKRRTQEIVAENEGVGKTITDTQAEKKAREELTRTRTNPAVTERLGSIDKAKQKWLDDHPEANGVVPPEVENQIRSNAYRSVPTATIDDKTARMIAEQTIAGRYQAIAALGYGGAGAANRAKVLGIVADIADERGLNGADIARNAIEFQATGRGASSLAQLEARTTGAITKAQATAPRVLEISDQIDRTRYPKINDVIISAQKNLGGEKVVRLGVAVETFINNYAMALGGGSSVMTDASKQHARQLLELGYAKGQMHAAVDQMMIEMESELAGIKKGLSTYLEPPQKGATPTFRPPANWEYSKSLEQYRDPQGNLYDKSGNKVK